MRDDIKEILDYLKDEKWDYYPSDMTPYKVFFTEERDKLLDYITNLQQENKDLKESNHNWQRKLSDYKIRIEKAVEYIKENMKEEYIHTDYIYTMIDILNGRGEE